MLHRKVGVTLTYCPRPRGAKKQNHLVQQILRARDFPHQTPVHPEHAHRKVGVTLTGCPRRSGPKKNSTNSANIRVRDFPHQTPVHPEHARTKLLRESHKAKMRKLTACRLQCRVVPKGRETQNPKQIRQTCQWANGTHSVLERNARVHESPLLDLFSNLRMQAQRCQIARKESRRRHEESRNRTCVASNS